MWITQSKTVDNFYDLSTIVDNSVDKWIKMGGKWGNLEKFYVLGICVNFSYVNKNCVNFSYTFEICVWQILP